MGYNFPRGVRHLGNQMTKWRKNRDASEGKDALPLPHYANHEQAIEEAIAQAGINRDEAAVAVTRDGKIYVGTAIPPTKLQKTIMKSKFLVRLLMWVGKTVNFFFVRVLRLPYPVDWIRTVRANRRYRPGN